MDANKFRILASISDKLREYKNPNKIMNCKIAIATIDELMCSQADGRTDGRTGGGTGGGTGGMTDGMANIMADIPQEDIDTFWRRMQQIAEITSDIDRMSELTFITLLELEMGTNDEKIINEKNITLKSLGVDPKYF